MKITEEQIQYVAKLARLDLAPQELAAMTGQLDRILSYVETLNELDTSGVAPTSHALAVTNAFRDDEVKPSLAREKSLANAPLQNGEAFVVPRVI
ncbi:MAG: Asp-tRNA(Asn)/Glu-tRNA(Gln) amidotransferase subunit GatC [Desulfobulbaceae bacterium]|nr:Asp-tRNA(Asn)/Glu-tRNA(Gln) amidotransferase subunit GatC [Desulfobulbaceae bacterium]